ncbi:hypothetical protein Y1Q_0020751 [Alligator mississippiensis]|uniref:Ig-like domain-containing protein n=1 Tax=Alligator mississippiensis TaxID=8496 RepID=A0A151MGC6_ALLMI|nr:hypothetical protein Y1Q_0020751 [Alligator mississippiensis]
MDRGLLATTFLPGVRNKDPHSLDLNTLAQIRQLPLHPHSSDSRYNEEGGFLLVSELQGQHLCPWFNHFLHLFLHPEVGISTTAGTVLDLNVVVLGSVPLISVEDYQEGGIRMVCRSGGWFPKPNVVWRDPSGQVLLPLSETKAQQDNDLFETETAIVIKEYTNSNLSCWIRDKYLSQGKESTISISGQFLVESHSELTAIQ